MQIIKKHAIIAPTPKKRPQNKMTNYFVLNELPFGPNKINRFPFFVDVNTFRVQLNKERSKKGLEPYYGSILHLCFDHLTNKIYLPDHSSYNDIQSSDNNTKAAIKEFTYVLDKSGYFTAPDALMPGNPNDMFRILKVSSFVHADTFIKKHIVSNSADYQDLVIAEVNIDKMPKTQKMANLSKNFTSMVFSSEGRQLGLFNESNELLYILTTPFILINISPSTKTSNADKERMVIESYKTYLEKKHQQPYDIEARIKYLFYIGWSAKEVCKYYLTPLKVNNIIALLAMGTKIFNAAVALSNDGYPNPMTKEFFYYSFPYTENLKIPIKPQQNNLYTENQPLTPLIDIMFDYVTSTVILKSSLLLSQDIITSVFGAKQITAAIYEPSQNTTFSPVNIKKDNPRLNAILNKDITSNISNGRITPSFEMLGDTNIAHTLFERKRISDYPQIADRLKELCDLLRRQGHSIRFDDIEVIVGPLTAIRRGMAGGYLSVQSAKAQGLEPPVEIMQGLKVNPPFILLDSLTQPSVGDRHNALIHEYQHHINDKLNIPSPRYNMEEQSIENMLIYLKSPDEIQAHIHQSMYLLEMGMTKDQIIKRFLSNQNISTELMPVARRYAFFVDQAEKQLEKLHQEKEAEKELSTQSTEQKISPQSTDQEDVIIEQDVQERI